jgi:hypothetical protein
VRRGRDNTGGPRVGAGRERDRRLCFRPKSAPAPARPGCATRSFQRTGRAGRHQAVTVGRLRGDARRGDCPNLSGRRPLASRSRSPAARGSGGRGS